MARPKPTILLTHVDPSTYKSEEVLEAEGDDCAICIMPLNDGQNDHQNDGQNIISLEKKGQSCGHEFHENCINQWIQTAPVNFDKCPTCGSST